MSVVKVGGGILLQFVGAIVAMGGVGSCVYAIGGADGSTRTLMFVATGVLCVLGLGMLYAGGKQLRGTPLSVGDQAAEASGDAVPSGECKEAKDALTYGIVSLFCFGVILGPAAILKAREAHRKIEANPQLEGKGKAMAGLILGSLGFLVWLVGIFLRFAVR